MKILAAIPVLLLLISATPSAGANTPLPGQRQPPPNETPTFPLARDDVTVFTWLRNNTSLRAGQAVAFTPDSVLVVLSDAFSRDAPRLHRISYRQEATGVGFVARTGGRSVRGEAEVDCGNGVVRASSTTLYSGSDFRGHVISSDGAETAWRRPAGGSSLALALMQVCPQRGTAPTPAPVTRIASAPPTPAPTVPAASPRPTAPATPAPAAVRPKPPALPAPTSASTGGRRGVTVQLGAVATPALAQEVLNKVVPDAALGQRSKRIEPTVAAGTLLYRALIDGFESKETARAFCAAQAAKRQACFVR